MLKNILQTIVIPCIILFVAYFIGDYFQRLPFNTTINENPRTVLNKPNIKVLVVSPQKHTTIVKSQGLVQPKTQTMIVAKISGVVQKINSSFFRGSVINKNTELLRIDASNYRTDVNRALAKVSEQEMRLTEELARASVERESWRNTGKSLHTAPKLLLRQPQIEDVRLHLQAAETDLEWARKQLSNTRVKMPYRGMVELREIDLGQYVSVGSPLGTIFSVDSFEVRLPVTRSDLQQLNIPNMGVFNESEQYPVTLINNDQTWQAHLVRRENIQEEATRLHYLVAEVKDPYDLSNSKDNSNTEQKNHNPLFKGSFVQALIEGKTIEETIVIPRRLIRNEKQVLVIDKEDYLFFKTVEVSHVHDDKAYIKAGLQLSDRVVLTMLHNPIIGTQANVIQQVAQLDTSKEAFSSYHQEPENPNVNEHIKEEKQPLIQSNINNKQTETHPHSPHDRKNVNTKI